MSSDDDTLGVYRAYAEDVRIVEIAPDPPARGPWYLFEAPEHERVEFEDGPIAELYAAVYFAVDGFREEDTGEKGIPLAVARSDEPVIATYCLAARSGTSVEWLTRAFDVDRETVTAWVDEVRARAADHPAVEDPGVGDADEPA